MLIILSFWKEAHVCVRPNLSNWWKTHMTLGAGLETHATWAGADYRLF